MPTVSSNEALVVWKQEKLSPRFSLDFGQGQTEVEGDFWPVLREVFEENHTMLDTACEAAVAGPIRFDLNSRHGGAMRLPHLAELKNLTQMLGTRAVLELHDGHKDAAWTNLLASTRLITAWDPEPTEVSHGVRFACAPLAYNAVWQALQAGGWADDRLALLQHEWGSVDFFRGLPETEAFARASAVDQCQRERQKPPPPSLFLREMRRSPRNAWYGLVEHWRRIRYRHHGSYEDECALLLYYRDRELQVRRAVQSPTWMGMRALPGVTNMVPFRSKYSSRVQSLLNRRQMQLAMIGRGQGLLGRAAEAEAQRRLLITAIALERYRGRHGGYPKTLHELVPELLQSPPVDFMDGKPLRYRLTDDGHFVLYSVGLDCVDNGGDMRGPIAHGMPYNALATRFGSQLATDLVWPRPASAAEAELQHQAEKQAEAEQSDLAEEKEADFQWRRTARRQAKVETILNTPPQPMTNEPAYRGRSLCEVLRNEPGSGTNKFTLAEMLTLKQIVTGAEPEVATFELPVNYDVLTNLGSLALYIDPIEDDDSDVGCNVGQLECKRATNGNCLLVWNTIYEAPGKHVLQAGLLRNEPAKPDEDISGPLAPFVVTNLCQFSLSSAYFQPEMGATFRARLVELVGTYHIELKSPAGERLKTITGSTSNGQIKVHWDLKDDHGQPCTSESYDSVFHLALPDSGRSQTFKGP
jgi:hypothetical protein